MTAKPLRAAALFMLLGALVGCGSGTAPTSGAGSVTLPLKPAHLPSLPETPLQKAPAVVLPMPPASTITKTWNRIMAGNVPMTSCAAVGKVQFRSSQSVAKLEATLLKKLAALGYQKTGAVSSSGPGYSTSGVVLSKSGTPKITLTVTFRTSQKTTYVAYWVVAVVKPKAGAHCTARSG